MEAARKVVDPAAGLDVDKLTYEIFSVLESKFLFGYHDTKLFSPGPTSTARSSPLPSPSPGAAAATSGKASPAASGKHKVCILSIDGGGRAADGLLAGAALVRLEASLRRRTGDDGARLADFFDVAAGSGAGGVLAAMLVARGPDGRPRFSAADALSFLIRSLGRRHGSRGNGWSSASSSGAAAGLRSLFQSRRSHGGSPSSAAFRGVFGDLTLRDTVAAVLVPCYDLASAAPFLFSRADAVETRAFDFRLRDVCAATCAAAGDGSGSGSASASAAAVVSCDGTTRIAAVGSGVTALGNPTAAAITHVLNNRRDFPLADGVDDLLVVSIGSGSEAVGGQRESKERDRGGAASTSSQVVRIAAEGVADMVDQAVAMAFGQSRTTNYIRIQATGTPVGRASRGGAAAAEEAEEMLAQRNVEAVLFRGKKVAEETNAEKLERFAHELVKERDRRRAASRSNGDAVAPAVVKKQHHHQQQQTSVPASYSSIVSHTLASIM